MLSLGSDRDRISLATIVRPLRSGPFTVISFLRFHWLARLVAASIAVAVLAVVAAVTPGSDARAAPIRCNGRAALCERRYDQVVFPATHNSFAARDDGFVDPSQEHGIAQQLRDGVRMFLVDTHHWETRADLERAEQKMSPAQRAAFEAKLTEPAVPPAGVYLCHMYCGLGATPLPAVLAQLRQFMERRPHEVIGLFIEDYVTARETAAAFDEAGLEPFLYTHEDGAAWPTLGEMIASGHRIVVFVEHHGGPPDWYRYGWNDVQDTRYDVPSASAFSCAANRGAATAPLFLLNNWVAKPVPSPDDAATVNSYGFLLDRARRCASERGQLPNFVAVNFSDQGDLFAVVNELNGSGPAR